MRYQYVNESKDGLNRTTWTMGTTERAGFTVGFIDEYLYEGRPSNRHKWGIIFCYYRLDRRNSNIENIDEVPFPSVVEDAARLHIQMHVKVGKEYPR